MFDWITDFIAATGSPGVAFLMFLENLFPPIPSALVMPLAGFRAARGELSLASVVLMGSIGSLLGALLWYHVGKRLGVERLKRFAARHGRWLTLEPQDVDRACLWFRRRGALAVFIGRFIPAVRTLISVPAGMAEMPLKPFLLYSAGGTVLWTTLLGYAGYRLDAGYEQVAGFVSVFTNIVVIALVGGYIWRVLTFRKRQAARTGAAGAGDRSPASSRAPR